MSIILGVDPGSRLTGYGLVCFKKQRFIHIDHGTIKTPDGEFADKLHHIFTELNRVIAQHKPQTAAIEQVFFSKNAQSALKLGQARGAAITAISHNACKLFEYSAKQIKQSVSGTGAADKRQIQQMVKILLNLNQVPQSDAADALACAICHCHHRGVLDRISIAKTTGGTRI